MKKVLGFILAAIFCVFAMTACGGSAPVQVKKKLVFGYSTPSLQNSFWITVRDAMQKAADEAGAELLIRDARSDNARQAADIEDFIQQKVDAILFTPYDSVSLSPSIKNVNKAGIPVIIVDIGINDPDVKYNNLIITDNHQGGNLAGQWLEEYIRKNNIQNPTVATIQAQLGAQNARDRHSSFLKVMDMYHIPVVAGQSADSLRDKAMQVMEDYLQTYPNLTAVFAECDDMALGALQAVEQARSKTVIIGYDGNADACQRIAEGTNLLADIDQRPDRMGSKAIEIALKVVKGQSVDQLVTIEPLLITRDNVKNFIKK